MNTLLAATDPSQNLFQQVIDATIPIGKYELHWLELIGVSIGIASAWLGMKRLVWAWPVGIVANIMLFFVYVGAAFGADERIPLYGQSGRQVFFIVVSIYGWVRWAQHRRRMGAASDAPAIVPRWMRPGERAAVDRLLAGRHGHRPPGVRGPLGGLAEPVLHAAVVVLLV